MTTTEPLPPAAPAPEPRPDRPPAATERASQERARIRRELRSRETFVAQWLRRLEPPAGR